MVFLYLIQSIILISQPVATFSLLFEQEPIFFLEVADEHIINSYGILGSPPPPTVLGTTLIKPTIHC